jgi:hypothetical protein
MLTICESEDTFLYEQLSLTRRLAVVDTHRNVVSVGAARHADPRRGTGLVDPDSLGEDRRREPRGEREQRGVPAFSAALDPVVLQAFLQCLRGDVLPGMPTGQQPGREHKAPARSGRYRCRRLEC